MSKYWCHNSKTGEIFSYHAADEVTDFPRGTWLAYGDYLTTYLKSPEEALVWASKYGACHKCKSSRSKGEDGKCRFCGGEIEFIEPQVTR